jgi:hypothetical protein
LRLILEYPLSIVLKGIKSFIPKVYIGLKELEIGMKYPVRVKYGPSNPPLEWPKGSMVALYMLLYLTRGTKPVVKLGTVSAYSLESAGIMWAQAPLYAKIVGVFHLTRSVRLDELEERGQRMLKSSNYGSIFSFVIRRGVQLDSSHIVDMWKNVGNLDKSIIKEYTTKLNEASEYLLSEMLKRLNYVELIYDGAWFEPIQHLPEIPQNFRTLRYLLNELREKRRSIKGLFSATSVGLCVFASDYEQKVQYIDLCREFTYTMKIILRSEHEDF